tara:strand:- start:514 stop:786 length:273 start_codon:yes stop_codon:yes gene_type:complete
MEYARKCSVTGEGMNNGWINEQTYEYFKYEKDAVSHIKKIIEQDNKTFEWISCTDDILEIGFYYYGIYYTEWECPEDMQYKQVNEVLTEI